LRNKARKILAEHRDDMDGLAKLLLEKENLSRKDLDDFFGEPSVDDVDGEEPTRTDEVLGSEMPQIQQQN
jgi:hypothetical protein